jgi:cellulose synthase/poly-beta-1,6-N-acetylglucosamine synthase-like glycosyltransferase
MIEIVSNPTFRPEDSSAARKKPGVSAIVRLRNEAKDLEAVMNSTLDFFDEFVIVYNQCSDRTPDIVEQLANREPQRVKAYHYLPEVFPQGSQPHRRLPPNHASSLVHYSNFALSKVSYRVCVKWDGDMIAAPEPLGRVMDQLRSLKSGSLSWWWSPWKLGYWWFSGVNLWDRDGQIYVVKLWPRSGGSRDVGFWPAGRWQVFNHHKQVEYLRTRLLKHSLGLSSSTSRG